MRTLTVIETPAVPRLRLLFRWAARFRFDPPTRPLRLQGYAVHSTDGDVFIPPLTATLAIEGHDARERLVLDPTVKVVLPLAGAGLAITDLVVTAPRAILCDQSFAFCSSLTTVTLAPDTRLHGLAEGTPFAKLAAHASECTALTDRSCFAHCGALTAVTIGTERVAVPSVPTEVVFLPDGTCSSDDELPPGYTTVIRSPVTNQLTAI